jgi:hypothetical protein
MASRPSDYLAQTGLPLLTAGLVFIILGGGAFIQQLLPKASVERLVLQWVGVCCSGAVFWRANVLRRRIVFPRGGYVVPRVQPSSRAILWGGLVVAVGVGIFAVALPGRLHLIDSRYVAPGFAICFAICCVVAGRRQNSAPIMWCGLYFVGLAPLLWWMPGNSYERMSALQLAGGILSAGAGALTLRRYIKSNPLLTEPKDE